MKDIPETRREERRQKRPVPLVAVLLALALAAAFILFTGPALITTLRG